MHISKYLIFLLISLFSACTFATSKTTAEIETSNKNSPPTVTSNNNSQLLQNIVQNYLQKTPIKTTETLTLTQAQEVQNLFVLEISKSLGSVVGYKAGLTNPKAQKIFNVSQPLRGTLLEKMLLENGSVISGKFASRPVAEGDLILRVGSAEINNAKTPRETLKYLDAVIPFLELPDFLYSENIKLDASALIATNVGARAGILGEPIPLADTDEWENRLQNLQVEILDENGKVLASGKGSNLLGNPLNVVLWIKDSLQAEGKELKKGDLLSLGSISRFVPVKSNSTIRARYLDLEPNKTVEIFVKFE
ncbi:hydratase [Okeania sp.]|uniref:2-keto-4-pentenoate hydratase n=1 Tax=Okeania sp. TaxID=3100323 RepID=UPI002B4AD857|nr:hydratase [Okeania sp.]MEB3342353.1 hydratase [Okeania sp.]